MEIIQDGKYSHYEDSDEDTENNEEDASSEEYDDSVDLSEDEN
jgi:hypothetical protein